jgi:hypothetical protein
MNGLLPKQLLPQQKKTLFQISVFLCYKYQQELYYKLWWDADPSVYLEGKCSCMES